MSPENHENPLDRLWMEYAQVFQDFDDLSLARWMAQTLGQLSGKAWRLSHPLVGTYRLAAQIAYDRHLWHKKLVTIPMGYSLAECCNTPLVPLFSRDVLQIGLTCEHCQGTAVEYEELPQELQPQIKAWAEEYAVIHDVAHQEDDRYQNRKAYDDAYEKAAKAAEEKLSILGHNIIPQFLEHYPVILWEDQDHCLQVRPEDIP